VNHPHRASAWIAGLALALTGCPAPESASSSVHVNTGTAPWPGVAAEDSIELAQDPLAANYYVIFDGSGSMQDRNCSTRADTTAPVL